LANGKAPTVVLISEDLFLNVEGLNDARTPLAGFFSFLLEDSQGPVPARLCVVRGTVNFSGESVLEKRRG
jgi:hypothetical protein